MSGIGRDASGLGPGRNGASNLIQEIQAECSEKRSKKLSFASTDFQRHLRWLAEPGFEPEWHEWQARVRILDGHPNGDPYIDQKL